MLLWDGRPARPERTRSSGQSHFLCVNYLIRDRYIKARALKRNYVPFGALKRNYVPFGALKRNYVPFGALKRNYVPFIQ
ncbi:hypothetical protein [Microcoleus sp. PH2017_25_DOB_D_A]|uniref:hypothetical protein n=1 Tax=Microcoleus sp. PH2017_25_DOB_D_A TaxID=2798835 RepID=UPI001D1DE6C2|nr:hypothetical protein [Microcoleus sp. PH2017_25_DOB_D_A]MCC3449957.1 hypothetical protein [Microcoleus sp. PH2017_09_SFU_O_A]MCC3548943.1 hypothetical protein [Microcoleus sp. PH2017_24_DOB_U_A]